MGSSQSTQHDVPQSAYKNARNNSFQAAECKKQFYPDLDKTTTIYNNAKSVNETREKNDFTKNLSDVTHYPEVSKYHFTSEELEMHKKGKEFNNDYAFHQQKSNKEIPSFSKEEPVNSPETLIFSNKEKEYNVYRDTKEKPNAPFLNEFSLQSLYKPPSHIKNLKEFIKSWYIWKEEMRSFLVLVDYDNNNYHKWGNFVLNRMGSISHEILQHLIFDKEDDKNNFSILINKFDAYHKFITNAKSENEDIKNYIERLKADSTKNIKDIDNMIKQKLEEEIKKIFKERFIAIASSKIPDFRFEKTFKSLTIGEIAFLWDLCDKSTWKENMPCKYCGKLHPEDKCFAFGKECNKCKRRNHFSKYCPGMMYISNCSFCGGDHGVKKCLAYGEKCSICTKLHHFSWMCSKMTLLRNCKFCGLDHVMDRSKCPAVKSFCSICRTTGHYDIKCSKNV